MLKYFLIENGIRYYAAGKVHRKVLFSFVGFYLNLLFELRETKMKQQRKMEKRKNEGKIYPFGKKFPILFLSIYLSD